MINISNNEEFADSYIKLCKDLLNIQADMYNTSIKNICIDTKSDVLFMITNKDTGTIRDLLIDMKHYYNERYDLEDPDNASIIHDIDILLDYIKLL